MPAAVIGGVVLAARDEGTVATAASVASPAPPVAGISASGPPIAYFLNERDEVVGRIIGGSDLAGFESALRSALA